MLLRFNRSVKMFGVVVILQLLLRCELLPTLGAHQVVLLLVHRQVALEAGQSAECLVALRAHQLLAHLVRRQVQSVVLLHVVRGAALLAPVPPIQVMSLEVPLIARQTLTNHVTSPALQPTSCVGLLKIVFIFRSPNLSPELIIL